MTSITIKLIDAEAVNILTSNKEALLENARREFTEAFRELAKKYVDAVEKLASLLAKYRGPTRKEYRIISVKLTSTEIPFNIDIKEASFNYVTSTLYETYAFFEVRRDNRTVRWMIFYKNILNNNSEIFHGNELITAAKETLETIMTLFNDVTFNNILMYLQERLELYREAAMMLKTLTNKPLIPATRIKALTQF